MKNQNTKKYSPFQKAMIIIVPIIVMLLIASVITLAAMYFTRNFGGAGFLSPGSIVIVMALCSSALAVFGIILAFVSDGKEPDSDDDTDN